MRRLYTWDGTCSCERLCGPRGQPSGFDILRNLSYWIGGTGKGGDEGRVDQRHERVERTEGGICVRIGTEEEWESDANFLSI